MLRTAFTFLGPRRELAHDPFPHARRPLARPNVPHWRSRMALPLLGAHGGRSSLHDGLLRTFPTLLFIELHVELIVTLPHSTYRS